MKICKYSGCTKEVSSRGWCKAHYMKWYHSGGKEEKKLRDPNGSGTLTPYGRMLITVEGKPLPKGAVIHHVNGIPYDNRPSNLVLCPSQTYHMELHQRQKALGIIFSCE